jgi:hypothetical protein
LAISAVLIPAATLKQRGLLVIDFSTSANSVAASLNCCGLTAITRTSQFSMCGASLSTEAAQMMERSLSRRWRV